jgi:hypothetical protein
MKSRLLCLAATAAVLFVLTSPPSDAAPTWAPEATATVHPGVQTFTSGAQCTANFVFTDGTNTYLGQAAHCAGTGAATDTNGCTAASLPLGTAVDIGGVATGSIVYSSWLTMHGNGEANPDTCAYNDLALVKINAGDVGKVNPTVPKWGGPTGVGPSVASGNVYSYGNSELRLGISLLSPKLGTSVGTAGNGWSTDVYTLTPGVPGDSGSGFLDAQGRAFGVLSTVAIAPLPLSNGVGSLQLELAYAQAHGFPAVQLANGTRAFTPGLPIG